MKKIKEKEKIIFIIILLIQVIYLTVSFGINKQGYHSDEMWNYGFANSTDEKNIYYMDRDKEIYKYIYSWTDSKVLYDYITVDKSEIFAYDKVYNNLVKDLNPPLHFFVLHFVCSLFLGKWSKWFVFVINMISFSLIQLFLYKFIKRITGNSSVAYIGMLLFGFCVGTSSLTTFLRMYAMGTAFSMMFVYYVNEVYFYRDDWEKCKKNIIYSSIILLLGTLTIHQFLIISFFVVLLYSLYYLFSKRIKLMMAFGLSMLATVGLSILAFPSTFSHFFGYTDNSIVRKYPTLWQIRIYMSFLTKDISGIHISAIKTMLPTYIFISIIVAAFFIIPICFIFRKEEKFKKIIRSIQERIIYGAQKIKSIPYTMIVLLLSIILYIIVVSNNSSIYFMGIFSKRYIFLIYPIYSAFFSICAYYLFAFLVKNTKIRNVVLLVFSTLMIVLTYIYSSNPFYIKHNEEGVTFKDIEDDANIIVVLSADWVLVSAASELYHTNSYFLTDYQYYTKMDYEDGYDSSKPLYLLLDISELAANNTEVLEGDDIVVVKDYGEGSAYNEITKLSITKENILDYFSNLNLSIKMEYVGTDDMYGRTVEIYRLN